MHPKYNFCSLLHKIKLWKELRYGRKLNLSLYFIGGKQLDVAYNLIDEHIATEKRIPFWMKSSVHTAPKSSAS